VAEVSCQQVNRRAPEALAAGQFGAWIECGEIEEREKHKEGLVVLATLAVQASKPDAAEPEADPDMDLAQVMLGRKVGQETSAAQET
jgi:hypothetical protein